MKGLTYSDYLQMDTLLTLQLPRTPPDADPRVASSEHFFIIAHQSCELWLKQVIKDIEAATEALDPAYGDVDADSAAELLARVAEVWRVLLSQLVALEKLPVRHFAAFRPYLETASGAQSEQFEILGDLLGDDEWDGVLYDSFKRAVLHRGMSLDSVCRLGPEAGIFHWIAEDLLDIADRYWQWKVTHIALISKLLGDLPGTGGTSGLSYLISRIVQPFGELRRLRSAVHAELAGSSAT